MKYTTFVNNYQTIATITEQKYSNNQTSTEQKNDRTLKLTIKQKMKPYLTWNKQNTESKKGHQSYYSIEGASDICAII